MSFDSNEARFAYPVSGAEVVLADGQNQHLWVASEKNGGVLQDATVDMRPDLVVPDDRISKHVFVPSVLIGGTFRPV